MYDYISVHEKNKQHLEAYQGNPKRLKWSPL